MSRMMMATEAAEFLGASVDQVRRWTSKWKLTPEKPYGKHGVSLYSSDDLEAFKVSIVSEGYEDQVAAV